MCALCACCRCELALQHAVESRQIREAVILQPCSIFGPHNDGGWGTLFFKLKETNGAMPGLPGAASFCDVRDLAGAFIAAASAGEGKAERYLIGGTNATALEMMQIIAKLVGIPPPAKATPPAALMGISRWNETLLPLRPLRAIRVKPDVLGCPMMTAKLCQNQGTLSTKAQAVLGYKVRPLEEILKANYDWLVATGAL